MFSAAVLVSFVLSVFSLLNVAASPFARETPNFALSFATRINATSRGFRNVVEGDRARARKFKDAALVKTRRNSKRAAATSFSVTDAVVTYTAAVGVGSPPTEYTLIIDTGSSNTWVGATRSFVPTSTSKSTGNSVSVTYGSGSFSGTEFIDEVALTPSLVIPNQSIGVASTSTGFDGVDGILGIGPVDLTEGTVSGTDTVPTVTDNLFAAGTIPLDLIGVFFAPSTSLSSLNGELTFGGVDTSKITSAITFTPITSSSVASEFWGIDQSISFGSSSILSNAPGIVDTGTTLIMVSPGAFLKYAAEIGILPIPDEATGLLKISSAQFGRLQNLNFNIGGETFALTPNAQIWPRALNTAIGGTADGIYLVVANIGIENAAEGIDFINGFAFLQRFYSVFDTTNEQVGFATTAFTTATSN